MSMYKFMKGSRLFMQGKREQTDYDNVHDSFAPTSSGGEDRNRGGYVRQGNHYDGGVAGGVAGGSSRHVDIRRESFSDGHHHRRRRHRHQDGDLDADADADADDEVRAVHTTRTMHVDGTTEWERAGRVSRRGGVKTRSTRTVRKVTTVTRGEQSVTSESVMSYSADGDRRFPPPALMQQDKRSLKFRVVDEKVRFIWVGEMMAELSSRVARLAQSKKRANFF